MQHQNDQVSYTNIISFTLIQTYTFTLEAKAVVTVATNINLLMSSSTETFCYTKIKAHEFHMGYGLMSIVCLCP